MSYDFKVGSKVYSEAARAFLEEYLKPSGLEKLTDQHFPNPCPWITFCEINPTARDLTHQFLRDRNYALSTNQCSWAVVQYSMPTMDMGPHPVVKDLLDVLARHGATINSGCQSGCELMIMVGKQDVAEFSCHIPELPRGVKGDA